MDRLERAVLAGGCFWCIEAQFQRVKGVVKVISGYAGGSHNDPKYEQVKKGETGHYEVV
jgi:peptide methionine sulfoxide reductase MsrA